jgi:hypothetical protein
VVNLKWIPLRGEKMVFSFGLELPCGCLLDANALLLSPLLVFLPSVCRLFFGGFPTRVKVYFCPQFVVFSKSYAETKSNHDLDWAGMPGTSPSRLSNLLIF